MVHLSCVGFYERRKLFYLALLKNFIVQCFRCLHNWKLLLKWITVWYMRDKFWQGDSLWFILTSLISKHSVMTVWFPPSLCWSDHSWAMTKRRVLHCAPCCSQTLLPRMLCDQWCQLACHNPATRYWHTFTTNTTLTLLWNTIQQYLNISPCEENIFKAKLENSLLY